MPIIKNQKKKADLSIRTLIELIFFAFIVVGVIVPIMWGIWEFFINRPDTAMLKQLDTLQIEINNIGKLQQEAPIFLKDPFVILAYKENSDLCEKGKSCICLCPNGECYNPDYDIKCNDLDLKLKDDCAIHPHNIIDPDTNKEMLSVQNCQIYTEEIEENQKKINVVVIGKCCKN